MHTGHSLPLQPEHDTWNQLKIRDDYEDYHVNTCFEEREDRVFVPCGIGNSDQGFFIYGMRKCLNFEHRDDNVYCLVYNYLVRNSQITAEDCPCLLKNRAGVVETEYRSIFRLTIILLQMIKNGYANSGMLHIAYDENPDNLQDAIALIDFYAGLFSRLMRTKYHPLNIRISLSGQVISLRKQVGVYACDNHEIVSNAREMWYGRRVRYELTEADIPDLEYLLREISPFQHFREGQFDALRAMLATSNHSVCIMPTGSGKSLIYYFLSILQPLPVYVISPTDILILDQIRNLKQYHHVDDVAHLKLDDSRNFRNFGACNKLVYLTPETFQNRDLLVAFRYINNGSKLIRMLETRIAPGPLAAYIVLDEVHCLSNWGHDFRPEYLMLAKNLARYLDGIPLRCFTATADYTVVEDIQNQLKIPEDNFISPVSFEKYNISYHYLCCKDTEEMFDRLMDVVHSIRSQNGRTIVFTKKESTSKKVAKRIGFDADVFSANMPSSYHSFASGQTKILVSTDELGVGVNLPDVRNIIHFGLPLSKNQYIQEIGRAGRANEHVHSYVLYLSEEGNVPQNLLRRNTPMDLIPVAIRDFYNDFADIYKRITNNSPTKETMLQRVFGVYQSFLQSGKALEVRTYSSDTVEQAKQILYMLYCTGFVADWYTYSRSSNADTTDIMIDICTTNAAAYQNNPAIMLNRMKERATSFFQSLGPENRECVARVNWAETPEEIFTVYVDWYYRRFLYHQNEQFLDLYDLIIAGSKSGADDITDSIRHYFQLPFTQLRNDEQYFNAMTIEEIVDKLRQGFSRDTVANLERILSNRYSYKLDFVLFFYRLIKYSELETGRIERILRNSPEKDRNEIVQSFLALYGKCDLYGRIMMLNFIESHYQLLKIEYVAFFCDVYKAYDKDLIYYFSFAKRMNAKFGRKQ